MALFPPSPGAAEQAGMCELCPVQEEPGGRWTGEVHPGVHPKAGGGVRNREAPPGQHDGRRSRELHPGGHRCKFALIRKNLAAASKASHIGRMLYVGNKG